MMRRFFLFAWLAFVALTLHAQSVITVSVPPGSYPFDQRISLKAGEGEEIFYSFAESRKQDFTEYLFPFTLSAIEGEERFYTLRVEARVDGETVRKKEFEYVIDKSPPSPPAVNMPEGTYGNPISLSLVIPEENPPDTLYYFCINGCIRDDAELWTEESIELSAEGEGVLSHTVKAYAADAAGNLSDLKVWTFTIDTTEAEFAEGLQILSPVSGVFANRQYLVVRSSGYDWVKYTLGGEDPAEFGSRYTEPFLLNIDGTIEVRVAGKLSATGEIRTAGVEFTVEEPRVDLSRLESGIYDEPLLIQLESRDTLYYSLDDTPAARKALLYESPFKIDLVKNGLKYIAFRVIGEAELRSGRPELRYFFILDDRTPSQPEIVFGRKPPVKEDAEVTILGPDNAKIYYTIDGTSPDTSSLEYEGPFILNLPEDSEAGSLIVKASAYGSNGRKSGISSALVTFDRIAPAAPEITYLGQNNVGGITVGVNSEFGSRILFEMTLDDSLPAEPTLGSYTSDGLISLDVPYGMERIFAFRFVAGDNAGNLSSPTDPFRVLIDKAPPGKPEIRSAGGEITISSTGTVFYTMTTDGTEPPTPGRNSNRYTGAIPVEPVDGELNELRIKAVAIDTSGNLGRVSDTFTYVDDRRKPYLPDFSAPESGGIYSSPQKIALKSGNNRPSVSYTVTSDGSEPPDPDNEALLLEDEIVFEGNPGESIVYRVKIRPFFDRGLLAGEVHELEFTIDREAPVVPVPSGFENGASYAHGVTILPPPNTGDEVLISIVADEEELGDPLGDNGRKFSGPIHLDTEDGNEITYKFSVAARDNAGNTTSNPAVYEITIDRKPPPKPVVTGQPPGALSRDSVVLSVTSSYPVYYEYTTDGSLPVPPTEASSVFDEALTLNGETGKEVLYTVRFLALDEVKNESPQTVARFTIDKDAPEKPGDPAVKFAGDSTVSISWSGIRENRLYYLISSESGVSLDTYLDYSGPFTIPFDEIEGSLTFQYYVKDKAGNRSEVGSMSLSFPGRTTESLFTGVENGKIYNSRCTLVRSEEQSDVRYEVTTNGPIPSELSPFSTQMPETLDFDAAPGETLRFAVRAAIFKSGDRSPVKEQIVRFTIDKTPPPPPEIPGWQDEMFFQDDFQVELEYAEGDAYVSVNDGSFVRYTGPVTLHSVSGGIDTYVIKAYVKDEAGNRSRQTREWIAYIDRKVIYVSENGNDIFDGSRNKPFRTLTAAIEEAENSERKTIYLSEGSYSIYEPIRFTGDLGIYGGFSGSNWKETSSSDTTQLLIAGEFAGNQAVLHVEDGSNVVLKSLAVRPAAEGIDGTLIRQNGGRLEIVNCAFALQSHGTKPVYDQISGDAFVRKTLFSVKDFAGTELIRSSGRTLDMSESSLSYEDALEDVAIIRASGVEQLSLNTCVLEPGSGKRTFGLVAELSTVNIQGSRIDSGQGKAKAIAVRLQECDFDAKGAMFIGNRSAWISTGIDASFSDVRLTGCNIDTRASRGVAAIRAEGTELAVDSCRVRGLEGREFVYLLDFVKCTGTVSNNMFSGTDTRDFIGATVKNSSLAFVNNTMSIGDGENMNRGIVLANSGDTLVVNNILYGSSITGTAIEADEVTGRFKVLNNAFDGWRILLDTPDATARTIVELNAADRTPGSGEIFGNIIESAEATFKSRGDGIFLLAEDSACVDRGFNPILLNIALRNDYEGENRTDPYDIGADEAY